MVHQAGVPDDVMLQQENTMGIRSATLVTATAAALAVFALPVLADQTAATPGLKTIGVPQQAKTRMIPSLAVLNSDGATLKDGVLTLSGIGKSSIVFADRPVRAAGHVATADFIQSWGDGKNSFAVDPPNATISVFGKDGKTIEDAVVVLRKPVLNGDNLTFEVSVLESGLTAADGPATLFIDAFAMRGPGGGFAVGGYGHVDAWHGDDDWHGGWYAHPDGAFAAGAVGGAVAGAAVGTAIGAAAAAPYYAAPYAVPYAAPTCGYYPLPPC